MLVDQLREAILAPFARIAMPHASEVFDRRPSGEDTRLYQKCLSGKHWRELTDYDARSIYGATLNLPAYQYYVQAVIARDWPEYPLGVAPEDSWLVGFNERSMPYYEESQLQTWFSADQLDAIASYVWFHAHEGNRIARTSYENFWRSYVLSNGVLASLGVSDAR